MKLQSIVSLSAVALVFGSLSQTSCAQVNQRAEARQQMKAFADELGLTDLQREHVRKVLMSHREEIRRQRSLMEDAKKDFRTASDQYGAESSEAGRASDRIAEAVKSRARLGARIRQEIQPILTPEQRRKIASSKSSFLERTR